MLYLDDRIFQNTIYNTANNTIIGQMRGRNTELQNITK